MVEAFDIDPAALKEWQDKGMEMQRYCYDVKKDDLILDIGAYRGEWSTGMVDLYGCKSYLFEPVPVPELRRLVPLANYSIIEAAAWTYNGRLKFGGNAYWTSHYLEGEQEYNCVDILGWLNQPIKVCKINIEGGEYDLLYHILSFCEKSNVENFQIQFHRVDSYSGAKKISLEKDLRKTHKKTWGLDWVWENWERI